MGVGEKTQEKILLAAETVFIRYGYEGARMDQIASEAGVLKANIYYYFSSKEELYRALITSVLGNVFAEVGSFLTRPDGTPWDRMESFLDVFFVLIRRYRGLLSLAFSELLHPPRNQQDEKGFMNVFQQVEQLAIQLIQSGIDEGAFADRDPLQTLLTLEAAVFYYFILPPEKLKTLIAAEKFSDEALVARKEHLRIVLRRILE